MLRITTGSAKNKRLKVPDIPEYRGVQEVSKSSVFAILHDKILNTKCLDLFAGSGNMGLEALSRGAQSCDFVDSHKSAQYAINDNIRNCNFETRAEMYRKDAIKYAANTSQTYDIIFLDPFYDTFHHVFLMENLEEILAENGTIFFFHGKTLDVEKNLKKTELKIIDERRFGKSHFSVIKKQMPQDDQVA